MLYVFLVNTGQTMRFKMDLALDTVENLKTAIFEQHHIPVQSQVLLISGGESLNPSDRVCKYSSAGTDTSPIFLFSKPTESLPPLSPSADLLDSKDDMTDRVQGCLQMEPNFNTVVSRAEMARQLYEIDEKLYSSCKLLVHDQHSQQQGWAAVVANLEDIVKSFHNKAVKVEQLYGEILKNKAIYYELLDSFESDKQILSRIPILKSLNSKSDEPMTLLDWILRKDTKNSLDELYCLDELNQFDEDKLKELRESIDSTLKKCDNSDMKEIRGLENRLSALDKLMNDAKKVFENQSIRTNGFTQNMSRATDLRDYSILPDLCHSQKESLEMMLKQHKELLGFKSRVFSAKNELSGNLHHRLRWIVHVEELLTQTDEIIVFYGLKLKKLREKLEIIQNLHLSPQIYLNSVVEVLRRRTFSERFYSWSQAISRMARELVADEVELRTASSAALDKHFLKLFFPGMGDLPADFTVDIEPIDQSLPQITADDLEYLRAELPTDMAAHLVVPSPVPLPPLLATAPLVTSTVPAAVLPTSAAVLEEEEEEEEVAEVEEVTAADEPVAADTSMLESLSGSHHSSSSTASLDVVAKVDCACSPLSGSLLEEKDVDQPPPPPPPVECTDAAQATSMTAKDIDLLASAKLDLESCLEEKNRLIESLVSQLATAQETAKAKEAYVQQCIRLNAQALELTKSLRVDTLEPIRHLIGKSTSKFSQDMQSTKVALERLSISSTASQLQQGGQSSLIVSEVGKVSNFEYSSAREFAHSYINIPATPDSPKSSKDIEAITAKYKLPKNIEMITQNNEDKISVTSCEIGDNVLVYYEKTLENFIVFTLTGNLHYIHTDSLKDCDFGKDIHSNEFQWIIAKVLDKEYCQIKKEENRYKLPVNKKFYRVKVKQISKCNVSSLSSNKADTTDGPGGSTNLVSRSYMPQTSNRTLFGSIFGSIFGTSDPSGGQMPKSTSFEKEN